MNPGRLPTEIAGCPRIEVRPDKVTVRPTSMSHEQSLVNFATRWRSALAAAESQFPAARRWHLVASAPVSVAIEAGRAIMRDAHPPVVVYEREDDGYTRRARHQRVRER